MLNGFVRYIDRHHTERKMCVSVTQCVSLSRKKLVRVTLKVHRCSKWVNWTHLVGKRVDKTESLWLLNVGFVYKWVRLTPQCGSFLGKSIDSSTESSWLIFFSQCSLTIAFLSRVFETQTIPSLTLQTPLCIPYNDTACSQSPLLEDTPHRVFCSTEQNHRFGDSLLLVQRNVGNSTLQNTPWSLFVCSRMKVS